MLLNPAVSNLFPNDTLAPLYKLWYTCITTSIATGVEETYILYLQPISVLILLYTFLVHFMCVRAVKCLLSRVFNQALISNYRDAALILY